MKLLQEISAPVGSDACKPRQLPCLQDGRLASLSLSYTAQGSTARNPRGARPRPGRHLATQISAFKELIDFLTSQFEKFII